jgi:hypothetical protein
MVERTDHKTEVEKAIRTVIEALAGPEPIEGLKRFQLRAACEFALEELHAVQVLKRPRTAATPAP